MPLRYSELPPAPLPNGVVEPSPILGGNERVRALVSEDKTPEPPKEDRLKAAGKKPVLRGREARAGQSREEAVGKLREFRSRYTGRVAGDPNSSLMRLIV